MAVESIRVISTPPSFPLSLFSLFPQFNSSAQAKGRAACLWGSSGIWSLGKRERIALN